MKPRLPLTLERFAALQARLDRGERLADVLASETLSLDAWRAAQEGWLSRMSAEATHKRTRLAHRYQEAYFAERPELIAAPPEKAGDVDGTALGVELDLGSSLPFVPTGEPAPARERPALANDALPFGRKIAAPPPPPPPPKPEAAPSSVDETIMVGELRLDLDDALPFRGERPPPPPAAEDRAPSELDGTSTMNPALALEETLPFDSRLTLEQYASFCAECEVNPEATAHIEQKYGLAPGDRPRLEAKWRKRLARDAASHARFHDLLAQYTRWLKRRV